MLNTCVYMQCLCVCINGHSLKIYTGFYFKEFMTNIMLSYQDCKRPTDDNF